jgi:XTP/dITP diphosphohydrolase
LKRRILFATGNKGKKLEATTILSPLGIRVVSLPGKGTEIQADSVEAIAEHSAVAASRERGKALIVEDAGLFVASLNGFPGPYSSYVFGTLGLDGLLKLLDSAAGSRAAEFRSAVAYCQPGGRPRLFTGVARGTISKEARGDRGFGFDPVFVPEGEERTFGEMTIKEKCVVSHRGRSLRDFAGWFLSREDHRLEGF